jgi:hypothetical protein
MGFMKPKIPPAPTPDEIARAQDRIAQEREARQVTLDKEMKKVDAANNLSKALKRKRGRGTLITRRAGNSYLGIKDDAIGMRRSLLGNIGGSY